MLNELNLPFSGGPSDALSRMRLRYLKAELRDNPAPNLRYIRQGVREFLPGMQKIIDQLPGGSQLLVMPSTTRRNKIPVMLAQELVKLRPDLTIINLKQKDVTTAHINESKIKGNYLARSSDHRHFTISDTIRQSAAQLNRSPMYILDDSISTGDSAIMLQRELLREGIIARGILTAVANEKYHARPSDLKRVYEKMLPFRPNDYPVESLRQDLYATFGGFPRKKIANFEIAFSTGELKKQKEVAFNYVRQSAQYMQEQQLGPVATVRLKNDLEKNLREENDVRKGPTQTEQSTQKQEPIKKKGRRL